jgi:hypothetical protein
MSHRPRSGDQFPGLPTDPGCCVASLRSFSVPLCLRKSQCFFSQRHGATEFLLVVSTAQVPAEIRFRGHEVLTSSRSCSYHDTEDQDGVSPVALSPCLCASVKANVFRTEARSHRVPARCVYRSRPSRDSFPRPEIRTFSPSSSRGGRSNWCVPSCSAARNSNFLPKFLTRRKIKLVCPQLLSEDQHGVSPVALGRSTWCVPSCSRTQPARTSRSEFRMHLNAPVVYARQFVFCAVQCQTYLPACSRETALN